MHCVGVLNPALLERVRLKAFLVLSTSNFIRFFSQTPEKYFPSKRIHFLDTTQKIILSEQALV